MSENLVTWDKYGTLDVRFGIAGSWDAFNDCETDEAPAGLACTKPDPTLEGPDGEKGWSTSTKGVCMKGIVPRVELGSDGAPDFEFQWGAGMSLYLGGDAGVYDATAHGIVGFMFDVTQGTPGPPAPPTLRISFDTASTADDAHHFTTILVPTVNQPVIFDELEQGIWVMEPRRFTANAMTAVVFDVYTNDQAEKPYDFCVSNFRVLCEGACIP